MRDSMRRRRCKECGEKFYTMTDDLICQNCSGKYDEAAETTAERDEAAIKARLNAFAKPRLPQSVNPRTGTNDPLDPPTTSSAAPKPRKSPTRKATSKKAD